MTTTTAPTTSPLAGLTVASVMHHGILGAPAGSDLPTLAAVMARHQVHSVLLTDADRPAIVTDLDLLAAAVEGDERVAAGRSGRSLPVVAPATPLDAAVAVMSEADARHVLVHDDGTPAGIVSSFDVVAVIGGHDPRVAGLPRPRPARAGAPAEARLARVRVRDAMHPGVLGVPARTTVRDLADTLARYRLHAACVSGVTEDRGGERLVWAIASDMDVLRAAHGGQLDAAAGEIAATEALTVDADEPLDEAAARMVAHGVGHAIVAAGAGAPPAGVLSSLDVLGVLAGDQG
ncbi:MAG: CBS domain-containing protein [Solirubrobacteraceae bacterium]|nr:CBS domain-containing protein [Solirubrobacteraceae bacterium]